MKTIRFTLVLTLALLSVAPCAAMAKGWYAGVAGGVSRIDDLSVSTQTTIQHDDGMALAVNGGYDFGWFRLDLEAIRYKNDVGQVLLNSSSVDGSGEVTMKNLVLNACFEYEILHTVTPWLGLGIGVGRIEFDNVQAPVVGRILDDIDSGALLKLQLGTSVRLGEHLLGTVSYERTSIGMEFTRSSSAEVVEDNFVGQVYLLGVRYLF